MVTRGYFSLTEAAGSSPLIQADWERSIAAFARKKLCITKSDSALTDVSGAFGSTSTSQARWYQWVTDPLAADTVVSGTVDIVVAGYENTANADLHLALGIRVMVGDTTTERGTLLWQGATVTEYTTSRETRIHNNLALTDVSAAAGDRICVEVGFHGLTPVAGASGVLRFGDPIATEDFAHTNGLTTDLVPWIEFSMDLTFDDGSEDTGSAFFAFFLEQTYGDNRFERHNNT